MSTAATPGTTGPASVSTAPIDVDLMFLVNQTAFALNAEMTSALAGIGISPREFCVLSHALKGDTSQIRLAELSNLDKTTMVATVDQLEQAGLAERRLSSTDRRARIIRVTAAGRRAITKAQKIVGALYAEVLTPLPVADRDVFLRSLITLVGGPLALPSHTERTARQRTG